MYHGAKFHGRVTCSTLHPVNRFVFALLALALVVLPGCRRQSGSDRTKVVVSIFPVYDLARRVAGPDADVTLLLQPGKNEHTFDPTPRDIEEVAKAKLGVMVGLGLDPWMEKLMKDAAPKARVLKVGDRVPTIPIKDEAIGEEEAHAAAGGKDDDDHDHEKGAPDPHVWLDPQRARLIVKQLAEELSRVDAAHAGGYRQRAAEIEDSLEKLDKEIEDKTKAWKLKSFVTFHGSFGYFADRYKLKIVAVIEPYPGTTPDGKYIKKVIDVVGKQQIPALFSEPQLDPRPAKVIADEAKKPLDVLDPIGGVGDRDSYEKTLRYDVAVLGKYLGGA